MENVGQENYNDNWNRYRSSWRYLLWEKMAIGKSGVSGSQLVGASEHRRHRRAGNEFFRFSYRSRESRMSDFSGKFNDV